MGTTSARSHSKIIALCRFPGSLSWSRSVMQLVATFCLATHVYATVGVLQPVEYAANIARAIKMASDTLGGADEEGVFIKTMHGRGCLDSGCCSIDWSQQLRVNSNCPTWGWLKWNSDGPLIVSQRPLFRGCLECENAELGCVAHVSRCSGRLDQQWRLKFASNWTTVFGEPLFAIASFYSPEHCLTLVNGGGDGDFYVLQECVKPRPSEWQGFYVVRNPLKR
ncbi:uncharacterized protein LOC119187893 [Rhipicephalus microplus]|uniref:Putative conserved secreted protein ovary overexpressed n=1 Tax=Rhipicephalus microplus TaxID=6941 RepID=A0A6M2D5Z8_RHIMP